MRERSAATSAELVAWTDFFNNTPPPEGDAEQVAFATSNLSGAWVGFERNDLGTLTGETLDGVSQWEALTFSGGPALAEVRPTKFGQVADEQLGWDDLGRLEGLSNQDYIWTDDGMLLAALENGQPVERRVYDAFGRAVLIERGQGTLERVFAGAQLVKEQHRCGERVWWPSSELDGPVAYTLSWDFFRSTGHAWWGCQHRL